MGFLAYNPMNNPSNPFSAEWHFSGFAYPNYTSVPDQLFDELMPHLSGAELKVLLYITRRTFGFKKNSDEISLSQMVNGIKKQNGKILDQGTGLGKASVARALNSLEQKKIILRRRRSSEKKGDEATTYTLNILNSRPVSHFETPPVPKRDTPVSHQRDTQQTVLQKTVKQQPDEPTRNRDVVVALSEKGITQSVAQSLANSYQPEQIFEKIELLEYKLELQTQGKLTGRPIGDPAAFLIDAIKKNYQLPVGFKTKAEREVMATAKKQRVKAQQRLADKRKQQEQSSIQQQELARVKRLETLRQHHHTSQREDNLWRNVLTTLQKQVSEVNFKAYLAHSVLLSLREDQALIAVPNRFIKQRVEERLVAPIQTALAHHLEGQAVGIHCQSLTEDE